MHILSINSINPYNIYNKLDRSTDNKNKLELDEEDQRIIKGEEELNEYAKGKGSPIVFAL